ncbi:MAG: 2-oxoacid:acceptor oxidoreductase family protein, partial [Candidatus Helarchaeota archaeon]
DEVDFLILMNKASFNAYKSRLVKNGSMLILSSFWDDIKSQFYDIDARLFILNDKAILDELKTSLPLSISMIGAFSKIRNEIKLKNIEEAVRKNLTKKHHFLNIKALNLGHEFVIENDFKDL